MVLALAGHLLLALGVPATAPTGKSARQPFPCQDRPCGCFDADTCWKGDCCCFTLEQKVEWAEANGIEPPAHVRPLVKARQAEQAPPCPECDKARRSQAAPPRWAVGAFAQKCRGEGPTGILVSEPAVLPLQRAMPLLPEPGEPVAAASDLPHFRRLPPASPPPRGA